jgi:hypothetical protein
VVLGTTDALLSGCRVHGRDAEAGSQRVSFAVPEFSLYLADEHGLLTPGQVERVALHEIGHALGMLGHSPDPHDMMYAAYRERSDVETLSQEDVNSFVSLYRLPNGADYALLPRGAAPPRPPPFPPGGVPVLAPAPQVDAMRGFSIRVPEGWLAMESPRGLFAANGPTWDFDTSLELAVWPYPKVSELLRRYGPALLGDGWLRTRAAVSLAGFSGQRIVFEDRSGSRLHDVRVLELGDGRVLMVAAQMPVEAEEEWLPWLDASLATLQVWEGSRD